MKIQELTEELKSMKGKMDNILTMTHFDEFGDLCMVEMETAGSPDEEQLLNEYEKMLEKMYEISNTLNYLSFPVVREDTLRLGRDGRFVTMDGSRTYSCGTQIEFLFSYSGRAIWKNSRVEHNGKRYYIVGFPDVELNGLKVRIRNCMS